MPFTKPRIKDYNRTHVFFNNRIYKTSRCTDDGWVALEGDYADDEKIGLHYVHINQVVLAERGEDGTYRPKAGR